MKSTAMSSHRNGTGSFFECDLCQKASGDERINLKSARFPLSHYVVLESDQQGVRIIVSCWKCNPRSQVRVRPGTKKNPVTQCWCASLLVDIVDRGELELRIIRVLGRVDERDDQILEQDL